MIDFTSFLNTVITMFVILVVGYVLGKTNVIDGIASKKLSKLIVAVAQPALIINSIISKQYSPENLKLSLISLTFGFVMHFIMSLIAFVACLKIKDLNERKITEFAMVFGNIGFLGIPVLGSLFPDNGEYVASFFVVSFNHECKSNTVTTERRLNAIRNIFLICFRVIIFHLFTAVVRMLC
jgi:predicted permease